MPLFYFDTYDSEFFHRDTDGSDLPDRATARDMALSVLPDMARDRKTPAKDRRDFIVDLRDANGRVIYTACMSLLGRWLD